MKLTLGPFILSVGFEYKPTSLRKAVIQELKASAPGSMTYAVKRARELSPGMLLKDALEYVRKVREEEGL